VWKVESPVQEELVLTPNIWHVPEKKEEGSGDFWELLIACKVVVDNLQTKRIFPNLFELKDWSS
jgi:hypothetical protein